MLSTLIRETRQMLAANPAGLVLDADQVAAHDALLGACEREVLRLETAAGAVGARPERPAVTVEEIVAAVAQRFDVPMALIAGRRRPHAVTVPRQAAMWLACRLTRLSYDDIGAAFGRDRQTVRHAHRAIEARRRVDPALNRRLAALWQDFRGTPLEEEDA